MLKKVFPMLMLAVVCAFATTVCEKAINTKAQNRTSEAFAGIYAAAVWNSNNVKWNKKAANWTQVGSIIGAACVKGALAGSGIGPAGTIICGAAVGL